MSKISRMLRVVENTRLDLNTIASLLDRVARLERKNAEGVDLRIAIAKERDEAIEYRDEARKNVDEIAKKLHATEITLCAMRGQQGRIQERIIERLSRAAGACEGFAPANNALQELIDEVRGWEK